MAPEHDARTRAFYDHESDDPAPRRRRAAADWGVNEDIFDRMPSRRFRRPRADHHDEPDAHRFERRVSGPARPAEAWADASPRGEDAWADEPVPPRRDDWTDEYERRQIAPRPGDWPQRDDERRADDRAARHREEMDRENGRSSRMYQVDLDGLKRIRSMLGGLIGLDADADAEPRYLQGAAS